MTSTATITTCGDCGSRYIISCYRIDESCPYCEIAGLMSEIEKKLYEKSATKLSILQLATRDISLTLIGVFYVLVYFNNFFAIPFLLLFTIICVLSHE